MEQLAVGDTGGGEEAVVAHHEIVGRQDLAQVVSSVDGRSALVVRARPQAALDLAAHALQRACRSDTLGRAADAEQHVDAGVGPARGDGTEDVAVGDQLDASARGPDFGDQILVAITFEDHHRQVAHRLSLGLGDPTQVLRCAGSDVDRTDRLGTDGDLLHVDARARVEHRAPLRDRDHRQSVAATERSQRRSVDRVDGDVGQRRRTVADLLAVVEHRRLVLLAFADDDDAVHRHGGEHGAHRLDGGAVHADLVAPSNPARRRHRRRLGDAHELEGEVAIRLRRSWCHGATVAVSSQRMHRSTGSVPQRGAQRARVDDRPEPVELPSLLGSSMSLRFTSQPRCIGLTLQLAAPVGGENVGDGRMRLKHDGSLRWCWSWCRSWWWVSRRHDRARR